MNYTLVYWRHLVEERKEFSSQEEAVTWCREMWGAGELSQESLLGPTGDVLLDKQGLLDAMFP